MQKTASSLIARLTSQANHDNGLIKLVLCSMLSLMGICLYFTHMAYSGVHPVKASERTMVSSPSANPQHAAINLASTGLSSSALPSNKIDDMIKAATASPRKRKMYDMTTNPTMNQLQTLVNVWIEGSYSPVHKHIGFTEIFVPIKGALALFTWEESKMPPAGAAGMLETEKSERSLMGSPRYLNLNSSYLYHIQNLYKDTKPFPFFFFLSFFLAYFLSFFLLTIGIKIYYPGATC